jgi:hypothetical protein
MNTANALWGTRAIALTIFILPNKRPKVLQRWQPHDLQIQQRCLNNLEALQLWIFLQELQCTLLILPSVLQERLFRIIIHLQITRAGLTSDVS